MSTNNTPPAPAPLTDDQISALVASAEATFNADSSTLAATQTAITAAESPLAAQVATVQTDIANYIGALNQRIAADTALAATLQSQLTPAN